jgi:hydrogenase expression/formation protein HypC
MCLGIPGKVAETYLQNELPMAKVDFGGIRKEICLAYVPEAAVGDYVIVHVGFALSRVDEKEAEQIFEYLRQIDDAGEEDSRSSNDVIESRI